MITRSKNIKVNCRIAVGDVNRPRSSVWRGFSNGDDVYLTTSGMAGIQKFSFHRSGICRCAYTKEEGAAEGETDRVLHRWKREAPVSAGKILQVLTARFPSDYLSTALPAERKAVEWIPPAPAGSATCVDFAFSGAGEEMTRKMAETTGRTIVSFTDLPSGEAFVLTWFHAPWHRESFVVPGLFGQPGQYVISKSDPFGSGRPTRFTWFIEPTNEWPIMTVDEFGTYSATLDAKFSEPMGFFTPQKVRKRAKLR